MKSHLANIELLKKAIDLIFILKLFQFAKLNVTLYGCSWYYWNKQNRSALLIMLANTIQPFRNSCFGLIHLNYELILKVSIFYHTNFISLKINTFSLN